MKVIGTLLVTSSMLIHNVAGGKTYSIKCGTDMFMCSDNSGLNVGNVCHNAGSDNNGAYIPISIGDCMGMINAIDGNVPFGAKCPNNKGISHYVVYEGCDLPVGAMFEPGKQSTCTCPSNTCGPSCGSGGGTVGGDPHFRTHDGTLYSYHGECDLVMARSKSFGNGIGLDVHARTTIIGGTWSLVSSAAVRIGNDVFEVENDGTYYVNGDTNIPLPSVLASNYNVEHSEEVVPDGEDSIRSWYHIDLSDSTGEKIEITNYKKMLSINVNAKLDDTVGMLGSSTKPGLIGRDGTSVIVDPIEMGTQWQVRTEEPMLFRSLRAPQYPDSCIVPAELTTQTQSHRRQLRAQKSDHMYQRAQDACKFVSKNLYEFCVQDIVMSGDTSLAHAYVGGVF